MVHVSSDAAAAAGASLPKQQRMLLDAVAGAAAGCVSRVIVAPLDLVKIRLQVQLEPVLGASPVSKYTGFTHAIATVLREEGVLVRCRHSGCIPCVLFYSDAAPDASCLRLPCTCLRVRAAQLVAEYTSRRL